MRKWGVLCSSSALLAGMFAPAVACAAADREAVEQSRPAEAAGSAEQAADQAQAEGGSANDGLGDIVITAQRRSESAQRAALAISVVSSDAVIERGVTTPSQLSQLIPAVSIQPSGGSATTFFVRGVGNFAINGYTDPAIAFNYDGVYVGRATSTQGLIYDIDRIELLKGPQGTLYGRNATSGAINLLPARPEAGVTNGRLIASYGNYNALNLQGAINMALGDRGAFRVSGFRSKRDGYLTDGTSDEDLTGLRVQMFAELTDTLNIRVAGDYSHVGGLGTGANYTVGYRFDAAAAQYVFTPSGQDGGVGLFDPVAQAYRQTRFVGLSGRNLAPLDRGNFIDNDFFGANAELNWTSPIGKLTIIPAFRSGKLDQLFTTNATNIYLQENDSQYSVEARLTGDRLGGVVDYLIGAFYYDETVKGNYTFGQQALSAFQDFQTRTEAKALFGRLTAHVSERLRVTGGVRYTDETKRFDGVGDTIQVICTRRVAGVPSCPTAPVIPTVDRASDVGFAIPALSGGVVPIGATGALAGRTITPVIIGRTTKRVNYRAAVEFDLAPRSLLYASFENGFRSGAFSLSAGRETYAPEFIDAYTVGIKNRFLDNRLQLNIEAFIWKYRDQQVTHPGFDRNGVQGQFTENIGRSTNKGLEVEARFLLTPNTLLSTDVQYLDAKYNSFTYQTPGINAPPLTGCASTRNATNPVLFDIDCSGRQSFQSPRWTVNLAGQQTFDVGGARLVFDVDTQYKTSRVVGFDYLPFQTVGANWVTNAQVSIAPESFPFTVAAFVRNIEGDRIPVASFNYALGGVFTAVTTPPRTYGIRLSAKF